MALSYAQNEFTTHALPSLNISKKSHQNSISCALVLKNARFRAPLGSILDPFQHCRRSASDAENLCYKNCSLKESRFAASRVEMVDFKEANEASDH